LKIKNKISVLLVAFLMSFSINIIGRTPSAIDNNTDYGDTVASQSASDPVTYEWNSTWDAIGGYDTGNNVVLDSSEFFRILYS